MTYSKHDILRWAINLFSELQNAVTIALVQTFRCEDLNLSCGYYSTPPVCASYLLSDLAKGVEKGSLLRSVLNSIWTGFSFFVTTWVLQEHMKFFEVGREWGPRLLGLLFRLDFQRSIIMLFHLFPLTSLNSPQIIFALLKPLNYIVQVDPWSVAGAFLNFNFNFIFKLTKLTQPSNLQSL